MMCADPCAASPAKACGGGDPSQCTRVRSPVSDRVVVEPKERWKTRPAGSVDLARATYSRHHAHTRSWGGAVASSRRLERPKVCVRVRCPIEASETAGRSCRYGAVERSTVAHAFSGLCSTSPSQPSLNLPQRPTESRASPIVIVDDLELNHPHECFWLRVRSAKLRTCGASPS